MITVYDLALAVCLKESGATLQEIADALGLKSRQGAQTALERAASIVRRAEELDGFLEEHRAHYRIGYSSGGEL